jgi:ribosome biogenesis protein Nip4
VKLSQKDKEFLEILRARCEAGDLWVDLKSAAPSYMVLRGTYGDRIHRAFRMSRQGVRWRFQRIFNEVYVSSFETILFVEQIFGDQLRDHAIRISRERHEQRQRMNQAGFTPASQLMHRR